MQLQVWSDYQESLASQQPGALDRAEQAVVQAAQRGPPRPRLDGRFGTHRTAREVHQGREGTPGALQVD